MRVENWGYVVGIIEHGTAVVGGHRGEHLVANALAVDEALVKAKTADV